jgi:pimeloyl-ACP methyl ester carboxylesterase
MERTFLTTWDATDLNHRLEGPEGTPVVVLSNSLGTAMGMWGDQAPALRERFRLLRYDTRGHGASPAPPCPYTMDDLGRDVLSLLDALGIGRASIYGLSVGGMTGMWLAGEDPELVGRLVLLCTSSLLGPKRCTGLLRASWPPCSRSSAMTDALEPAFSPERCRRSL